MNTYLLFRNSKNERLDCNMYNNTDIPVYVQPILDGPNKGYFLDILRGVVISVNKSVIKYAPLVNDDLKVIKYYDDNCQLVTPLKPLFYSMMYNL